MKLGTAGVAGGLVLVVVIIICGAFLGYKGREGEPYVPPPLTDCDADDRSPHWEVRDCGPSPRPVQIAPQKKTTPKPATTRRR